MTLHPHYTSDSDKNAIKIDGRITIYYCEYSASVFQVLEYALILINNIV